MLLATVWLLTLAAPTADARRRRRKAKKPRVTGPPKGPMPSAGTPKRRLRIPPPLRLPRSRTATDLGTGPKRVKQLRVSEPQRRRARRAAREALRGRKGPERVARLAAAGVGVRSAEAARVLAARVRVTTLRRLTRHKDSRVRQGVAVALAHRPRVAPVLIGPLLVDRNLRVVRAAVQSAARLGDRRTVGALANLALRYDRSIRALALRVLAVHAKVKVARRTVIAALTHTSASVRVDGVVAVGLARADWARYWLTRRMKDRSSRVRRSVARALLRLSPTRASFRVLARLRRDRSPVVRSEARRVTRQLRRIQRAARRARRRRGRR